MRITQWINGLFYTCTCRLRKQAWFGEILSVMDITLRNIHDTCILGSALTKNCWGWNETQAISPELCQAKMSFVVIPIDGSLDDHPVDQAFCWYTHCSTTQFGVTCTSCSMLNPGWKLNLEVGQPCCCLLQEVHRACYIKLSGTTVHQDIKRSSLGGVVTNQASFWYAIEKRLCSVTLLISSVITLLWWIGKNLIKGPLCHFFIMIWV